MSKQYYVYILTNKSDTVLYTGVTSDLVKRVYEHRNHLAAGFTATYNVVKLVYYEVFSTPLESIKREKQIKNWHRPWKINLIKARNPGLDDLYSSLL